MVTHATPIKSAVVWVLGGQPSMILNLWVDLGNVSIVDQVRGSPLLTEYNSKPHLGG